MAAFAGTWVAVVALGNSWWQLALAAASRWSDPVRVPRPRHRPPADVRLAPTNEWTARILSGGFAGLSYGWWTDKHNRHHDAPNQEGKDPDIAPGASRSRRDAARARTGFARLVAPAPGLVVLPAADLEGLNLHVASVRHAAHASRSGAAPPARAARSSPSGWRLYVARAAAAAAARQGGRVPRRADGGRSASAWAARSRPTTRACRSSPPDVKVDFLRRQVLMSRNIRGGLAGRLRDGRAELPDRAPPVPEHAAAEPAARSQPIVRELLRASTGVHLHRGRLLRVVRDRRAATSTGSGCARATRSTARWWPLPATDGPICRARSPLGRPGPAASGVRRSAPPRAPRGRRTPRRRPARGGDGAGRGHPRGRRQRPARGRR